MLSNGSCGIIEEIRVERLSKPETTYNIEVADFHTYYVTASKVLCHNKCSGKKYNSQQEAYDAAKSDLGINANEMPLERRISYYDDGTGYWSEQIMDVYSDNRVIVNHGSGHVYSGEVVPRHYNAGYLAPETAHGYKSTGRHYFY